ncbi:TIGR03747 family integrating conjugative element membrane protein (plasmid) [Pseudomonas sp. App30]|uniref:TIGR03747 family integrating conjugative element membrane protein n=1 Tax=Pseudomonas sp. App30 TaxID=3068990 RepID=UPI003A80C583
MPTTPVNQTLAPRKPGLILATVELCLRLLGVLFGSMLFSIVLEFAGMVWFWPDQSWHHSQAMWQSELGWLSANFKQSLIVAQPAEAVGRVLGAINEWLFVSIGWGELQMHMTKLSQEDSIPGAVALMYVGLQDYLVAALFTLLTFIVRVAVLGLSMPLFLLAGVTGAVDGLMRRDLRKFGAGRESSFVYHRAKRLLIPMLFTPWVIYLSFPWSINPTCVLVPCAWGLGWMVAITGSTFKKYL